MGGHGDNRYWMLDTGYWMLDPGCRMPDAEYLSIEF
jgi:hypothetical protein